MPLASWRRSTLSSSGWSSLLNLLFMHQASPSSNVRYFDFEMSLRLVKIISTNKNHCGIAECAEVGLVVDASVSWLFGGRSNIRHRLWLATGKLWFFSLFSGSSVQRIGRAYALKPNRGCDGFFLSITVLTWESNVRPLARIWHSLTNQSRNHADNHRLVWQRRAETLPARRSYSVH